MAKRMTYDKWFDTFKPVKNHLDPNAAGEGTMFETFGAEDTHVRAIAQTDPKKVWTELDVDGRLVIVNGWHYVNRIGYYITEVPYDGPEITVRVD
jgi:hypothetical protein